MPVECIQCSQFNFFRRIFICFLFSNRFHFLFTVFLKRVDSYLIMFQKKKIFFPRYKGFPIILDFISDKHYKSRHRKGKTKPVVVEKVTKTRPTRNPPVAIKPD